MPTLVANDVLYLSFYLQEKDNLTGSITYYDLSTANSIVFRMRKYGSSTNAISEPMEIVTATLGYCRVKVTVPTAGTYYSEIEVFETSQNITWTGPIYYVKRPLG